VPGVHAFFDFDDTLLRGDSILYWQRFYYAQRPWRRPFQILNWAGLLLHGLKLVDSHTLKRLFLLPVAYEKPEALDALAREFVAKELAPRFHAPVLERLWTHHKLGHEVIVISASATFYLKHLKDLLPMARIEGSEMRWADRGLWRLPAYRDGNLRGANKLNRLKAMGLAEREPLSFAYSDHHHDAFLLGFTGFPSAVRPTKKLRALAAEKGWPVMEWTREAPAWLEKLGKALLLFFAVGPDSLGRASTCDPARQAAESDRFVPAHIRNLQARVDKDYPAETRPEVHKTLFGSLQGAVAGSAPTVPTAPT
jgi:HAD superfamily phosphoserine phosphatase-like hydrolase